MAPNVRETYSLPKRVPVSARLWIVPGIITLVVFGLWLALPRTPLVAGLAVVVVILTVGVSIGRIMMSRQLTELPGRNPVKPPSAGGD